MNYHKNLQAMQRNPQVSQPVSKGVEVRAPKADVFETVEGYYIRISLPGVKKKNLNIFFNDRNQLEISGKVVTERPEHTSKVLAQEIFQGPFHRVMNVPQNIDKQNVQFNYVNGILEIHLTK
ncbi:Hsp20/alpha crystallin family protein [Cytobacillus suaedae]|nr:Hsp20/alpha crystallin family protein [Cytobacillus suaedae]